MHLRETLGPTAVIVNARAGRGRARRLWETQRERWQRSLHLQECAVTEDLRELPMLLAKLAERGMRSVLVWGGDGTLHGLLQCLLDEAGRPRYPGLAIAMIPAGSGCDYARTLGVPMVAAQFLEGHREWEIRRLDVLRLEYSRRIPEPFGEVRWGFNSLSLGLSGRIVSGTRTAPRPLPEAVRYVWGLLRYASSYRSPLGSVRLDGEPWREMRVLCAFVCNGDYSGGGMRFAPQAMVADGAADALLLRPLPLHYFFLKWPLLFQGRVAEMPGAEVRRLRSLQFEFAEPVPGEIDGEPFLGQHVAVSVVGQVLPMLVPQGFQPTSHPDDRHRPCGISG